MSDELIQQLRQVQGMAAALQGLISEAQATAPARSQAEDSSGAVTMVLDADGMPTEIVVASDWQRRIDAAALSGAVMEAFSQAAEARMQTWTRIMDNGSWGQKVGRMMESDGGLPVTDVAEVPTLFRRDQAPTPPRPAPELAEDMIRAFENVDAFSAPVTAEFSGANGGRTVGITLSGAGLAGCTINSQWADKQSGTALSDALGDALASARAKLKAAAGVPRPTQRLDSLLDEAMSLLGDPRRLADS